MASLSPLLLLILAVHDPSSVPYDLTVPGKMVHFLAVKPQYDREVATLSKAEPRIKVWDWGGALLISGHIIVYDDSDQVAMPVRKRSRQWIQRSYGTELVSLCHTEHFWGHYYFGVVGC